MIPYIVVIAGGIGAGKSYVAEVLRRLGYKVYDCDSRAKSIMNTNEFLKAELKSAFGSEIVSGDGQIDRRRLAELVFSDSSKLLQLNSIVHPAVILDIKDWIQHNSNETMLFVETAIPDESGISELADALVYVEAPEDVRIQRVIKRSRIESDLIKQRIKNQKRPAKVDRIITNDGAVPLLPQIVQACNILYNQSKNKI